MGIDFTAGRLLSEVEEEQVRRFLMGLYPTGPATEPEMDLTDDEVEAIAFDRDDDAPSADLREAIEDLTEAVNDLTAAIRGAGR